MEVKIKKLHENAVVPFKAYDKDFCYDVVAVSEEEIAPNVWKYKLGIAMQIERGDEVLLMGDFKSVLSEPMQLNTCVDLSKSPINLSLDFRPRSSIYKTGMILANSQATGDEGYTGEYMLVFYHVMPNMPRYKVGDKIAQMKIGATFPIEFKEVSEFEVTQRGEGGFGSSGK